MPRKNLTDLQISKLKPPAKGRLTISDPLLRGHYVRVTGAGAKSFCAVARSPHGKQIWATIGGCDVLTIDDARTQAREAITRIKAGLPAFEEAPPKPDSFRDIAESYIQRHVEKRGLRSQDEIERVLSKYVYPSWDKRDFTEINRTDVTRLLDSVQDNHGASQADSVLAIVRGIMNWHATRTDNYTPAVARGMRRTDPKKRARDRILSDDEIRIIWKTAEANGKFGAFIRLALLTAQRRKKVAAMKWADLSIDGAWNIPAEDREKGSAGVLPLPDMAVDIIMKQKRIGDNAHVFAAARGEGHFTGYSKCKTALDAKVTNALREAASERGDDPDGVEPLPDWTVHDLRRTARSLLSRAGVRPDIGERVMGHVIRGVEGIYDRHSYTDEKKDALQRLAALVGTIINPPSGNVVPIREVAE